MAYVSNADRRMQFIAAATKVIRMHGVANATTRRIAEEASAPLGTLHYCFKNKEELFEEVAKSFGASGKQTFQNKVHAEMGIRAAVRIMLKTFSEWNQSTVKACLSEIEFHLSAIRSARHKKITKNCYMNWINFYTDLLEKSRRPDEMSVNIDIVIRLMIAFQDGITLQNHFLGKRSQHDLIEGFVNMLTAAIDQGQFESHCVKINA